MIVLKIIGWVLLSLIAIIIIALCIKVRIIAEYSDDNTSVMLQWLFLKIPLYPVVKKKNTAEEPAEAEAGQDETATQESPTAPEDDAALEEAPADTAVSEETPVKKAQDKPKENLLHLIYRTNGIDGIILLLKRVFSYTGKFFGSLLNGIVVEEFYLDMRCAKGDAAKTAINYGEVCSAVFPLLGALISKYKVRKYDINIYPDYLARFSDASFNIKLYVIPQYLIGITLAYALRLLNKVIIRLFVKIFLHKNESESGKQNIKNTEKSGVPNE